MIPVGILLPSGICSADSKPAGLERTAFIHIVTPVFLSHPLLSVISSTGVKIHGHAVNLMPAIGKQRAVLLLVIPVGIGISVAVCTFYYKPAVGSFCAVFIYIIAFSIQDKIAVYSRIAACIEIVGLTVNLIPAVYIYFSVFPGIIPGSGRLT